MKILIKAFFTLILTIGMGFFSIVYCPRVACAHAPGMELFLDLPSEVLWFIACAFSAVLVVFVGVFITDWASFRTTVELFFLRFSGSKIKVKRHGADS